MNQLIIKNNLFLFIFYCSLQKENIEKIFAAKIIPPEVEIKSVALACLAKLEVIQLLKALESGARGVVIWGCADEDCLYALGNKVACGRFKYSQKILKEIGIEDFRFQYIGEKREIFEEILKKFNNWLKKILPGN